MPRQTTPLNLRPRYNGCPTQDFAGLLAVRARYAGHREASLGIVPKLHRSHPVSTAARIHLRWLQNLTSRECCTWSLISARALQ